MMNCLSLVDISSAEDMLLRVLDFVLEEGRFDLQCVDGCVCCGNSRVGMVMQ